jgi:2-polyprenyl-6-hydroxyphenyl methylase / 3-demethylubiquinone-9 3-methyltransferase
MERTSAPRPGLTAPSRTIDPAEVEKFERLAGEWWNPDGKFRPLHKFNPVRLAYIRDTAAAHFRRDTKSGKPLLGLSLLDIGCGGGLLTEPMARLGAEAAGADPAPANIAAARRHAELSGLAIDYRDTSAEAVAAAGESFDIVLAMEVVEHVADVPIFLATCGNLVRPGGLFFVATINRTPAAFALAIVGAEYILRWLPRGTHDYSKLIRPQELQAGLVAAGLKVIGRSGVRYNPLADRWSLSTDLSVNYMMAAEKAA